MIGKKKIIAKVARTVLVICRSARKKNKVCETRHIPFQELYKQKCIRDTQNK